MKKISDYTTLIMAFILSAVFSGFLYGQNGTTGTVTDIDGNVYKTVKIGNQWWMAENLKVTHYRNSDPIPNVTDNLEWSKLSTGAYCSHKNNDENAKSYGRLYNWYAVNDSRSIAPAGWHVATDKDWKQLEIHLGMSLADAYDRRARGTNEGSKLAGNAALWKDKESLENNAAFGTSGFSALPGGSREDSYGNYTYMGINAYFWSSTESDNNEAWYRRLYNKRSNVLRNDINKRNGFSVRCVKDMDGASSIQQDKDSIVGVYMHEEKPENYLVLDSDGTFYFSMGRNKMNGKYEKKSKKIALTFENGNAVDFKIENDTIIDPEGKRWIKE